MNNVEKAKSEITKYCELRNYNMDVVKKLKVTFNSEEVFFLLDKASSSNGQGLYADMEKLPYLIFTYNIRSGTILETDDTFKLLGISSEEIDIPYEDGDDEDEKIQELLKLGADELEILSDKLEEAELKRLNALKDARD